MALTTEERRLRAARRFGRIGLLWTALSFLVAPAFALLSGWRSTPALVVLLVLLVAAVVLQVWRIRLHLTRLGAVAPAWFAAAAAVVALGMVGVGTATSVTGWMWSVLAGILLGDVVAGMGWRGTTAWVGAGTLVATPLAWFAAATLPGPQPVVAATSALLTAVYVSSFWVLDVERLWWLKSVTDLEDSRRTAADLATARERLRLADDLHDILGHALEVVAFKSELAARLQEVDPGRARTEMEEVQRVARESLTEVRALVRTGRDTDLVLELAGARAVLGSAGVALEITGDPAALTPAARTVLGRVLREAMTNVLRHAQPTRCTIEVVPDGLVVCNDGVSGSPGTAGSSGTDGTGLAGLERYLADEDGRLTAGPDGRGGFRLEARLGVAA